MASIRNRSGKWQARINRNGFIVEKTFLSKRDAEKWTRITEGEIERGDYHPPLFEKIAPKTLEDLLTRYLDEVSSSHKSKTTCINIGSLKKSIGHVLLSELNAQVIACWRDDRLQNIKPQSVLRELHTLSSVLNHARKEWCYGIVNPCADIKQPANGEPRTRRLLDGEESKLLNSLTPSYGRIVRFALETAMRRGEILSLVWQNVNIATRVARLPITKNGTSRCVPLSKAAIAILNEQRLQAVRNIDGKVFNVSPVALDKAWRAACKRANITDLHFHDLRHEAISRLADILPNVLELSAVTGHKDLRMLKRYHHPKAEDLAKKLG
ncbi:MAG: site-specific integrase [Nitrosomonadales bacterium]